MADKKRKASSELRQAVAKGDMALLASLLEAGADPDEALGAGLHTAAMSAASSGELGCLSVLIAAGASLDCQASLGHSALMFAAEHGHDACVRALLAAGADMEIKNVHDGWTAAMFAAIYGRQDCFQTLVDAGADITVKDIKNRRADHYVEAIGFLDFSAVVKAMIHSKLEAKAISCIADAAMRRKGGKAPRGGLRV